ncbi:hypothetical protein DMA11_03885 [Marinilabiliaceae bacterium JC017]|nr:hypothetical protein DMA11_03885 [Marinilabiliaceae bacterium JC017]
MKEIRMKSINTIIIFALFLVSLVSCKPKYNPALEEYTEFLKEKQTTAKDYVLEQWKQHDVVVLCERDHAELTQYDLINEITSSDYFIKNVGCIFTEVGSFTVRNRVLVFLHTTYKNENLREAALIKIYRELSWPIWEKSNTYFMLLRLNKINQNLKPEDKIQVYTSDEPIPSNDKVKSKEDYLAFEKKYLSRDRDSVMAENIIAEFDSIQLHSTRKKCLVIMNYRHAFLKNVSREKVSDDGTPLYGQIKGTVPCTAALLAKHYPNKVASIYINAMTVGTPEGQQPIQNGKWDASFKVLGKENVGFNFNNSPFGADSLDIWGFSKPEYTYANIFTGMVYYLPFEKHIRAHGLDNFIDDESIDEIYQRLKIYTEVYGGEIEKQDMKEMFKYKEGTYYNLEQCRESINRWIKTKPHSGS